MFSFIIDIFCKDTVIGLSDIFKNNNIINSQMGIYKNFHSRLFQEKYSHDLHDIFLSSVIHS